MEIYLGYECTRCPENVKLLGYKIIDKQKNYQRTSSTKRKKAQTNIISYFKNDEPLLLFEQKFFGSSRTEVMVATGISFSVIEINLLLISL